MDTGNIGNIVWAVATIGGPILLGLIMLLVILRRRRGSAATSQAETVRRINEGPQGSRMAEPDVASADYREVR